MAKHLGKVGDKLAKAKEKKIKAAKIGRKK